jgi:hypothetical protein
LRKDATQPIFLFLLRGGMVGAFYARSLRAHKKYLP